MPDRDELRSTAARTVEAVNALLAELPRYPIGSWVRPTHGEMDRLWSEVDSAVDALGAVLDREADHGA
jgi:hypothetical protein